MIRPFVKKELYERIFLHYPTTDYSGFFEKYVPRSHMPSDYGGDMPSVEELHDKNRDMLIEMREYFLFEENQMNFMYEDQAVDPADNDDDGVFLDAEDE